MKKLKRSFNERVKSLFSQKNLRRFLNAHLLFALLFAFAGLPLCAYMGGEAGSNYAHQVYQQTQH